MTETTASRLGIGATADASGLSIDTIRYYDRLGLLGDVVRDSGGRRLFTEDDVGWLRILRCLRDTGMSMRDLRRFCGIDGTAEPARRRMLLEEHRVQVLERIARLHGELDVLDGKIAAYRRMEDERGRVTAASADRSAERTR